VLHIPILCDSLFWIEIHRNHDPKIKTSDGAFVSNQNKVGPRQFSWKCPTDETENRLDVFCEVSTLRAGSGCESASTFYLKKLNHFVKFDECAQIIIRNALCHDDSFTKIVLSSQDNLRQIHGFEKCVSLRRTELPP
jgi:hypothetical protein